MSNIPERVNQILNEYFDLFESRLPNVLKAYVIFGSVSLGAFNDGFSDIDFVAVVNRKFTEADLGVLKEVHNSIKIQYPKTDLMGMYVMEYDLSFEHENTKSCPCFIDGIFKGYQRFEKNSIDAYQLKKYGITIKGQGSENLKYTVDWDILIHNMRDNINTYWFNWENGCKKFPSSKFFCLLLSLGMVEWGVLGVTRLYYTFKEGDMTSKVGAGEYALKTVPQRWHKIINESMRLRKGIKKSYYKSIFERRKDALDYIEYIIKESNNLFN